MKILISTIVRNREKYLDTWYNQIIELVKIASDCKFDISVYENDSIDNSQQKLNLFDYSVFGVSNILCEKLNTRYYGSVLDANRVANLARARNKTLEYGLDDSHTHVLSIEPDVEYNPLDLYKFIKSNKDADIASGLSYFDGHVPYDAWATRKNRSDNWWNGGKLVGVIPVHSTYNCVCLYKAEPIREGAIFYGVNAAGKFDCDTVVICENFRDFGYSNIVLDCNFKINHKR